MMTISTCSNAVMKTKLEELFERHYPDPKSALVRFRKHLAEAKLDFDVEANISELTSPPNPSFPKGIPSFIYYYVPGSQFGSVKKLPTGANDPAHIFSSDGIGLNMGCPIRLARALDVLFSLKIEDRKEPLGLIRAPRNHFACVEELLWLTLWKRQAEVCRGGELVSQINGHKAADIDWFFISGGTPIYLEAKFRPTDWMRSQDCGGRTLNEGFFGEIGRKFPSEKSALHKRLAAITGFSEPITDFADPNNTFFALCEKKLLSTPGLDGILYRSLLGGIYVCSLDEKTVSEISQLIQFPEFREYPPGYPVVFNRELREQRAAIEKQTRMPEQGRIIFAIVPYNKPTPSFQPQFPYRCNIPKRGKKGEPNFEDIPAFLNPMPTLLLSARQTDDAQLLWRACIAAKWKVERVQNWQVPYVSGEVAVYGEPLFAQHVGQTLGLKLLEPPVDWLPQLPAKWRGRDVRLLTLAAARQVTTRAFIKPADEKCFDAKVYASGSELPAPGPLPEDLPVLVQEVVAWETEFRCFVLERKVVAVSPYWRNGQTAKADNGKLPPTKPK
jgi:hypothetical protein